MSGTAPKTLVSETTATNSVKLSEVLAPLADGRILHQGWSPQCEKEVSLNDETWAVLKTTAIQPMQFLGHQNKVLPSTLAPRNLLEVTAGDILVTNAGPRARCGIACVVQQTRPRLMISGKMYRFRAQPSVMVPRFLAYFLQSDGAQLKIDNMKTGISDSGLNLTRSKFLGLEVPKPLLAVQREVVASLELQSTRLDSATTALYRAMANLKRYRAAVLQAAVTGRLVPTEHDLAQAEGREYESGEQLLQRILEERRRTWSGKGKYKEPTEPPTERRTAYSEDRPRGWQLAGVEQLIREKLCNGISVKGSDEPPGVQALKLSAMTEAGFDYSRHRYLPLGEGEVADLLIQPGDFFVSRGNGSIHLVGRGTHAQASASAVIFPDTMIRLRLVREALHSSWVPLVWRSRWVRQQVEEQVKTTAGIYKISQAQLEQIEIPLPPLAEQVRIVAEVERRLSVADALERTVEANLTRATRLRQTILKRAFTAPDAI